MALRILVGRLSTQCQMRHLDSVRPAPARILPRPKRVTAILGSKRRATEDRKTV